MKYRKLRVAWSFAWGVMCLLLIALWVRSYSYLDTIGTPPAVVTSWRGQLLAGGSVHQTRTSDRDEPGNPSLDIVLGVYVLSTMDRGDLTYTGSTSLSLAAPLVLLGMLTIAPWIRSRFSLRTLLIAVTVVAVGLGLAVYVTS
jgi:hypothetical protein